MSPASQDPNEQTRFLLFDVSKVDSLEELSRLSALETLSLHGGAIPSLEPLAGLKHLETLYLASGRLPDLRVLAKLPALKTLDLGGSKGGDLSPLADLPALRFLTLPENVGDISFLEHMRLEHLTMGKGYEKLARLKVGAESLAIRSATISDLSFLAHLKSLKGLSVGLRHSGVKDLTPLASLRRLESLHVPAAKVEDLSPLSKLKALKRLQLPSNKKLSNLKPLSGLLELRELDLNLTAVKDLKPLQRLVKLETLTLRGTKVESLQPLLGLKKLEQLFLEKSRLKSLEGISALAKLRLLWCWGTKVKDLSPLAGLPHLEDLNIADLGSPQGTEAVSQLPALKRLDVFQTEFNPELLRGLKLDEVRGCQYPLPGSVQLDERPPAPGTQELGPGTVLDGRLLGISVKSMVTDLALSPDGSRVAVALGMDNMPVQVFSTRDASEQQTVPIEPGQRATGVAFTSTGALYVLLREESGSSCQLVKVLDGGTELVEKFQLNGFSRLRAHPTRPWLAALGLGARVWDLKTGACLHTFEAPEETYKEIVGAFSDKPARLFLHGTEEGQIVAHDMPSGKPVGRWEAVGKSGEMLTVSHDGAVLTSTGQNSYGTAVIDTKTGQRLYTHELPTDSHGGACAVSPDGTLLVECHYQLRGFRLPPRAFIHEAANVPAPGPFTPNAVCTSTDGSMLAFATFSFRTADFRVFWAPMAVLTGAP